MSKPTPEDWKKAVENSREQLPMEADLWASGCDLDTAHFVAKDLRRRGFYLVHPDHIGWDEIRAFKVARKGKPMTSKAEALEEIREIELPAGTYKINGEEREVRHTFIVRAALQEQSAVDVEG